MRNLPETKIILMLLSSFIYFLTFSSCISQTAAVDQDVTMHRIQDTTKSLSGWYYGKSSEGNFSIELPIPFNDFTLLSDGSKNYVIGSKSIEGLKFTAIEMIKSNELSENNLEEIIKFLQIDYPHIVQ